jgi:hypothetical protein
LFFYVRPIETRSGTADSNQALNRPPIQPQDRITPLPAPATADRIQPKTQGPETLSVRPLQSAAKAPRPTFAVPPSEAKMASPATAGRAIVELPIQGRNTGSASGSAQGSANGPAPSVSLAEGAAASKNQTRDQTRDQARALVTNAPRAVAAAPAPPQSRQEDARASSANTTVNVATAPVLSTSQPVLDAQIQPENSITLDQLQVAPPLRNALPSGLPVLSMAEHERKILAIDTSNAVFFSKDGGKHWRAVAASWQGHAVKVDLAELRSDTRPVAQGFASGIASAGSFKASAGAGSASDRKAGPALTGVVVDATGAVIPGATVVATNTATHAASSVTADKTGRFAMAGLIPGSYDVEVHSIGFMAQTLRGVVVADSQTNLGNLVLSVGSVSETVAVQAESPSLETPTLKAKKLAKGSLQPSVFAITTDNGERWTSTDGITWIHP